MEQVTPLQKKKKNKIQGLSYWLRVIHRDIGYLAVGLCLIYGTSGILLNHLEGNNPAYKKEEKTIQISPALSSKELKTYWKEQDDLPKLKKVLTLDDENLQLFIHGGIGTYNAKNGIISYEVNKKRLLVYWINQLHYNNVKGWTFMADFFAGTLIFLAISGLFILKGKNGFMGRGKWFFIVGILIPILYILL